MMNKHLFLFTLGPVQSFIAQARKTHDLYSGSQLLSNLVKVAIDTVGKENVIFPDPNGDAMPNRFIAWVYKNETELQVFGESVEKKVRGAWFELATSIEILKGISKPDGYDEQINAHLEIFWVFEPNVTDYPRAYMNIEKSLGAIKNVRPFHQFAYEHGLNGDTHFGEIGRKCGLDGQRNVKFFRKTSENQVDVSVKQNILFTRNGYARIFEFTTKDGFVELPIKYLQPGEGLSAVSYVKRRYLVKETEEFKSTADIALWTALAYLEKNHLQKLETYIHCFKDSNIKNFNAQLFFEENLTEKYFKKQGIKYRGDLEDILKKRQELESLAREGQKRFSKYYAILTFDGDSMGKWLSGKFLTKGQELETFHTDFAKALSVFAKKAEVCVNTEGGRTAYAGGDDFVGFVNLNQLFDVLKKLRQLFREHVSDVLLKYREDGKEISFSAGICIAHYKEPLSLVLDEAKKMQDKAKDVPEGEEDKNRFGITVLKGSGEDHRTVWKFGKDEQFVDIFKELVVAIRDDIFSNNFTKTLRREFERLADIHDKLDSELELIFETELKRMILRGCQDGDKETRKKLTNDLVNKLLLMFRDDNLAHLENFLEMLHIADFIQRNINYKVDTLTHD